MLEYSQNIQKFVQLTGGFIHRWGIIPDRQMESRFVDHPQWVHLSTICDMFVRDSVRKYWSPCTKGVLFYLHENFGDAYFYEEVRMTEWAREGTLNRKCTKSCTDCPELNKSRKSAIIECRHTI